MRVLVTGGGSGIGRGTVDELLRRGAEIAVIDARTEGLSDDVQLYRADVTVDADVRDAVTRAAEDLGGVDVVIHSAGVAAQGTVGDNTDEEWLRVFDVNVFGVRRVNAAALPYLRRSPCAAIVHVSSAAARNGLPRRALYSATKGALVSLTLAMAADHVGEGIRVNAVCPGTVDTPWIAELIARADDPEREAEALRGRHPLGRLLSVQEVADAILYLASPRNGSTTGTVLDIDGGMASIRATRSG
uniref:Putative dehydrogenase n=1 Tax=Arthrobacter globiformis TaxID=1665 RepID=B8R4L4_ARTGO|nr:putative dehydrogenase [Arthrobacter globiformis]